MHARRLYAHRGAPAEFPENTMMGFERAVALSVDVIESDLHLTRDGHVILAHDPSAARLAGVDVQWREIALADALTFDLGHGFTDATGAKPFVGRGLRVVTLQEVLQRWPTQRWNFDIKQAWPSMVAPVLATLAAARAAERVTLASFSAYTLRTVRQAGYPGETALAQSEVAALRTLPLGVWRAMGPKAQCAQIPTHAGPLRLDTAGFIAKCHEAGLRVDYWTINDQAEADRLLALGADGIMTDAPAVVRIAK